MATVYPDSIVDQFVVDDGHVANPISSFQVRGVYPSYFVSSVCGETTCGTGHVALGAPGTTALSLTAGFLVGDGHYVGGTGVQFGIVHPTFARTAGSVPSAQAFGVPTVKAVIRQTVSGLASAGAFGAVTINTSSPQTKLVTGLASAGAFGAPTVKATISRSVGAVASVQAFGTILFRVSAPIGGVSSAQQFGVPSAKAGAVSRTVGSVASAASFGAVSAKSVFRLVPTGLGSAQAFGVPTTRASIALTLTGLGSAQAFGAVSVRTTVTRTLVGLGSAQAFGPVIAAVPKQVGGVSSAAAFGVPQTKYRVQAPGLGSAQAFGTPTIPQRVSVPGVQGSSAHATTIVETFKVDDGHVVSGESDLSYFGKPWVGHLWLLEFDCIESPEPAICGVICGVTVCGGESFLELSVCIGGGAIVHQFICGQQRIGVGESFLDAGYAASIVDRFLVDDGHVVDGQLDNCLDSPLPALCDPGTICGTVVCGGASYISELDCLFSPDATIVNTFLCGQLPVGGVSYNPPITVTRTIDLQPVGCL